MADKIRIGIIGSGGIARAHVRSYKQMVDVEIVAVADIVPGRAEEFIAANEILGAQAFDDHRKLLELELDGVSICTPNVAHHQTSVDALNAGKHVLTEKPMAVTLNQAIDMVQTSKATGKMLTVGFQPRYDVNHREIKRIVQSGQLGKVYHVQTGGGRRRGIPAPRSFIRKDMAGSGAMADIGCYSLDMAMNAIGYPKPLTVSAYTANHFGTNPLLYANAEHFEVEDFAVALIRFEGDVVLNFKISWSMHMDSLGDTLFLGTEGGLKVVPQPAPNPLRNGVWDKGVNGITLFHDVMGHPTQTEIPIQNQMTDIFYEKIRDFVVAIQEGKPAPIPGEQILFNQAVIEGILRSADIKREVEIKIPEM
jgi:predicted dehydrogenase